jgi:hypothetical protein
MIYAIVAGSVDVTIKRAEINVLSTKNSGQQMIALFCLWEL